MACGLLGLTKVSRLVTGGASSSSKSSFFFLFEKLRRGCVNVSLNSSFTADLIMSSCAFSIAHDVIEAILLDAGSGTLSLFARIAIATFSPTFGPTLVTNLGNDNHEKQQIRYIHHVSQQLHHLQAPREPSLPKLPARIHLHLDQYRHELRRDACQHDQPVFHLPHARAKTKGHCS